MTVDVYRDSPALSRAASDGHVLFMRFIAAYVVTVSASAFTGVGLLRAASYAVALLMFAVLGLKVLWRRSFEGLRPGAILAILLYSYGLMGSTLYNLSDLDYITAVKLLIAPYFVMIGSAVESASEGAQGPRHRYWFLLLLVGGLPLAVLAFQLLLGVNVFARGQEFSIFSNRNNAALFAVVLISAYTVCMRRVPKSIAVHCLVGSSFGTLGVLIAIVGAIVVLVAKRDYMARYAIPLVAFACAALVLAERDVGVFGRLRPVVETIGLILDPRVHFESLSYERLYHLLDTTDLSLAFRFKHWLDLLGIYTRAPIHDWIFGLGVGASVRLTQAGLVPHNDYLRVFVECGPIAFLGFVWLLATVVTSLGRQWAAVPILAVSIYMISENLVDNFLAMTVFYYSAGVLMHRTGRQRPAGERTALGRSDSTVAVPGRIAPGRFG